MQWAGEPKLEEVLSDPIIRAVMERDRVDQEGLRVLLRNATKLLALPGGPAQGFHRGFNRKACAEDASQP
jgi:hypothetical protein